jgi:D-alanyl-D-alanine dipeptidase
MKFTKIFVLLIISGIMFLQCKSKNTPSLEKPVKTETQKPAKPETSTEVNIPKSWQEITTKETGILLDIRYATKNNFTKKQIYDCPRCFLRPQAAKKLLEVHNDLKTRYGYGIKVFDCFRPRPYQQRLWDIVPDPSYVTPPEKGSMHSRGLAVDLTIVDKNGKELDMGTEFDFFGEEAHHDYSEFPASIQKNRVLIKKVLELHGFSSIRTEWWHYSLNSANQPLDEWVWPCLKH